MGDDTLETEFPDHLPDHLAEFREEMRRVGQEGILKAAAVEAAWDGRDFSGLSNGEKKRYVDRFKAAMDEYSKHVLGWER